MKLYAGPVSLFSRKTEIALIEKGLAFELVLVPFSQTAGYSPRHPDVLAANPKAQVPVLVDEGLALYDSTVILEYLEEAYPEPALLPALPRDRAEARLLDVFADEVLLVPLRDLMHRTTPRAPDPAGWDAAEERAEAACRVLRRRHGELDGRLGDRPYFTGAFGMADISLFMAVLWGQRLGGPGLDDHPALAAWYGRLKERPAFARVVAEIVAADRELSAPVAGGRI